MTANTDERNFKKGDVFNVDFPSGRGTYVMQGKHRAVVLYDCSFPRKTVVVAPITSLYNGSGVKKGTIDTDVELPDTENYLEKPSIVKTEQLTCVDRSALGERKGTMSEIHLAELSFSVIDVLELGDAIEGLVQSRLQELSSISADEEKTS